MIKTGGVTSLYRGVTAPLMGVAPIFALSFAGNAAGQNIVRNVTGHQKLNYGELFAGGCIAGIYSTVIMAPGERIKVFNTRAGWWSLKIPKTEELILCISAYAKFLR